MKVQSLKALEAEMRAVARGEIAAPADAAAPSVESEAQTLAADRQRDYLVAHGTKP